MRTRRSAPGLSLAVSAVALFILGAASAAAEPVHYGGAEDYDACPIVGEVRGLDPKGDDFLAVRAGPGIRHRMLDRIHTGQIVHVCDQRGSWLGIVYGKRDCAVDFPILMRSPYRGPCRSGWVSRKYIAEVAG